jgi:molybdenum cofactor cytidylyltransferase
VAPELASGTAAVVLAAGEASRFGGPKLVMPFGRSTIIGCVVSALEDAGVSPIVVVVAADSQELAQTLAGHAVQIIYNLDPARGMLSSLQVGLAALPAALARFLVALGDQPRISTAAIMRLLKEQESTGKGIVIPTHKGKRGHPVLFHARYRAEIMSLPDTETLREIVHAHADDIAEVAFPSNAFIRDIDTREQYEDELRRAQH